MSDLIFAGKSNYGWDLNWFFTSNNTYYRSGGLINVGLVVLVDKFSIYE